MIDYRATGQSLREKWLTRQREFQRDLKAAVERIRPHDLKHNFIHALCQHARGNSNFLIDYLRSDRPLGAVEREYLAQVLEGVLDRRKLRGRPAKAVDLGRKLEEFRIYCNENRVHQSLSGSTPGERSGQPPPIRAVLDHYAWRHHCPWSVPDADRGVIYEFAMDTKRVAVGTAKGPPVFDPYQCWPGIAEYHL